MALGAVYASQIAFRGVRRCLRRLAAAPHCQAERDVDRRQSFQESTTEGGTTVNIHHDAGTSSLTTPSSTSLNISIQSGSQHRDENPPAAATSSSSSARTGQADLRARAVQPSTSSSTASGSAMPEDTGSPKEIMNPWNRFQHDFRGKGFSKATMAKMYKLYKDKDKDQRMP